MNIQRLSFGMASLSPKVIDRMETEQKNLLKKIPYPECRELLTDLYNKDKKNLESTLPQAKIFWDALSNLYIISVPHTGTDRYISHVHSMSNEPLPRTLLRALKQAK